MIKPMMKKLKSILLIGIFTGLLSSCGFHLRGDYLLADELQTLYVTSSDIHGELTRLVKLHLSQNQVNIVKSKDADHVPELRIVSDKLDRRTLSVFSNGQVAEYELIYSVHYLLQFANEDAQHYRFELYRDYLDDPNLALAKSRELTLLLSEMRTDAADKILRDMATIQR